jgi:hypothetical protein
MFRPTSPKPPSGIARNGFADMILKPQSKISSKVIKSINGDQTG